jgi:hypothetical protein
MPLKIIQKAAAFAGMLAALALLPGLALADESPDNWSFDVTPYVWLANIDVRTKFANAAASPLTPRTDSIDFDTSISAAAMVAAQVHYRSFGLLLDFVWLRLDSESKDFDPAFSGVNLTSDFIRATPALTYSLPFHDKFHADLLAGVRVWHANEDLNFKTGTMPGFDASAEKTWVVPVVGANLSYDFSKRWYVTTKGSVGGFGDTSSLDWEVLGAVGFRVTDWCSTLLGYRYMHEDHSDGGFGLHLEARGFVLGANFHF